ncbi:hypothetical protein EVJ58_g3193 [Rhodofomes roseus]|uniref:Pyridoxamine 5'-phosphate oxidase N-terminal domain-containing protein n=1 Tax=Rhodofomes roseus TaxID=34475 RepID=A0A4Y9YR67_9APHY|nr:hypothetical protein EVJ58_g3193 [Rhodofomes roseus]
MGKFYESIPPNLIKWIEAQQMFWVATAPLSGNGHVNVSPKGLRGSLHVVDENQVWYEDMTGSGSEAAAHLREPGNGRITLMFSAFDSTPRILRLFGQGTVHEFGTPEYEERLPQGVRRPGSRSAIVVDIHKVGTSCGFGVPLYDFIAHRPMLLDFAAMLESRDREVETANGNTSADAGSPPPTSDKGLKAYWRKENMKSIDGLPALTSAPVSSVTPIHAPPDGSWGKKDKDKSMAASTSVKQEQVAMKSAGIAGSGLNNQEVMRLVLAFSMGLAVAAVYVQLAGVVC